MLTCDHCLSGKHFRCRGCGCRTCDRTTAEVKPRKRYKPKQNRTSTRPARIGPPGKPGRPRVWSDDRERKREHMRRKRAAERGQIYIQDFIRTSEYLAEVKRLEEVIHG